MDTNLDEDQLELAKMARSFFQARFPISTIRELEQSEVGFAPEVWQEMASLDWLRLGYPESDGGAGGSALDLTVLYQEMGRSLAPVPHLESSVIAGGALHAAGTPFARDLLEQVWAADALITPAIVEADGSFGPEAVTLAAIPAATADGNAGEPGALSLTGDKLLVAYANSATHLIVAVRTAQATDEASGVSLVVVRTDSPGLALTSLTNVASVPLYAVRFDAVTVPAEAVIGPLNRGWELLNPALERATVLRAAQIQGAAERLLEYAVEYSTQRSQFGKPIGQYQAVQYLCSDIAINSHLTSLYARYAAGLLDAGLPAGKAVSQAKAQANRTARLAPERAHAVHAGIAFMLDFDVQLFTRRCRHWELDLGDDRYHRERIATALAA
ncbi:acyl-CoA dehydrogenase family protein [Jatrophihabitans sp. DSM 45814]